MPPQLCRTCLSIPPYFWAEDLDAQGFPWGPYVKLQPYRSLEASAAAGCPLCSVLIRSAQVDWLGEQILRRTPVTLSRACLDSHQGICLAVDLDDISHTTFYRVPKLWSKSARNRLESEFSFHPLENLMSESTETCLTGGNPPLDLNEQVDNFQIMKIWIQNCRQNHTACNRDRKGFLPTRLLDLRAFGTDEDVKLVSLGLCCPQDQEALQYRPEYITLSHCWGPPEHRPITTTKASLEDRMSRIPVDDLSNTFRDAVGIARTLGARYLWIDSLCIIQDDGDDWAREAALMAEVYGQSLCTLAALDSKNSTEGCKLISDVQNMGTMMEMDTGNSHNSPYTYRIRVFEHEPQQWHEEYGDNPYRHADYGKHPLRARAWTLQERELSKRNIHFAGNQMLWECREQKASTQLPWHHKKPEDDFEQWPIRNFLTEDMAPGGPVAMRDRWYELMEDYSFRQLTKETDKLTALAGLARSFQPVFPQAQYLPGIWSTHLPAALLWRTRYTARRPQSYIAPTWSWASVIGTITYESQRLAGASEILDGRPQDRPWDCDFGDLSVGALSVKLKYHDKYGTILDASLSLNGALLASIDSNPQLEVFDRDPRGGCKALLTKDGVVAGLLFPDIPDQMPFTEGLFCLRIRGESNESQIAKPGQLHEGDEVEDLVMGLVLMKASQTESPSSSSSQYKRIGLARWVRNALFEASQPSAVTLL